MIKSKKLFAVAVSLLMGVTIIGGCGTNKANSNSTAGETNEASEASTAKKKIAVIVKGTEHPYWQTVKKGAEAASEEFDVDMYFTGPAGGEADINGQVNLVETAINEKVDGIVLASCDENALVPITEKAADAGIPIVLIDSNTATDKYISYATTNNEQAAYEVGKKLGELTGGKGKVAIVSFTPGAGSAIAREGGFKKALEELYPDMEIVTTEYCDSDKVKALSITQNILTSTPDLTAIYATNEPSVVGVGRALKEKNNKDIIMVGFDSSDDIIPLLEEGYVKATAVQRPYQMGYLGFQAIADHYNGKAVEKNVDTGALIVTPENMETKESQEVLYPLGK